jgi:hypothetical protein
MIIKDFYFISGLELDLAKNLPRGDDCHFFDIFLWITPFWRQKKIPKKENKETNTLGQWSLGFRALRVQCCVECARNA